MRLRSDRPQIPARSGPVAPPFGGASRDRRTPAAALRAHLLLTLACWASLAAASCGDPKPADPAAPHGAGGAAAGQPSRPPAPPEAWIDDEALLAAVVESARTGSDLPAEFAKLPPRVAPVRVAVRALHDHLVGVHGAAPQWEGLVAALDRLAAGERTKVDRGALAPLLAAWRAWTPEQRAAEAAWAEVYARRLDLLRSPDTIDAKKAAAEPDLPPPPPRSPAEACLVAVRAVLAAVVAPGHDVPADLVEKFRGAQRAFETLGWPGGLAPIAEIGAARLERDGGVTLRSAHVRDLALAAYGASGDALRKALVLYDLIGDAERQNDGRRAVQLAQRSLEQIEATGTRGRELGDALFRHGGLLLATGKPAEAAKLLGRAVAEIAFAGLDPALGAPYGERLATALWCVGRWDEAVDAADAAVRAFDAHVKAPTPEQLVLRAELQELGARARTDGGSPEGDGARRFLVAAESRAKLPGGAVHAAMDRLFAADAWRRAGRRDDALKLVEEVLAPADVRPAVRAQAAGVLRELGSVNQAREELARAVREGSPAVREALGEEWARLLAADRKWADARAAFAAAAERLTKAAGGGPAGQPAAKVLLDWARMEAAAGDLDEAARLADRGIPHLEGSPWVLEIDRIRKFWVGVRRRQGRFLDAEQGTALRLASGPPGPPSVREDAAMDLFVTRLAAASIDPRRWAAQLDAAAALLSDETAAAWARRIARPADAPKVPAGAIASGRAAALALAGGTIDRPEESVRVARELLAAAEGPEWELSRWVLDRMMDGDSIAEVERDPVAWVDLRRGEGSATRDAVRAALAPGDAFVTIDAGRPGAAFAPEGAAAGGEAWQFVEGRHVKPLAGAETWSSFRRLPSCGGLNEMWQAVWVDPAPEKLEAAAKAFLRPSGGLRIEGDDFLWPGAKRVVVSIASPFGVLPLDLVPRSDGGKLLFDEIDWAYVTSPSEFLACAQRPAPETLTILPHAEAPLTVRHAVAQIAPVDEASRARFATLLDEARRRGLGASAAVRDAKLRLRNEWAPAPSKRPVVPPWAAFALRGAP